VAQGESSTTPAAVNTGSTPAPESSPGEPPAGRSRGGQRGRSGPPGNENAQAHGGWRAKQELKLLGRRAIDGRTSEAREVAAWVADYAADLGGVDQLTTGQRTLLRMAGTTALQLARLDGFIATMDGLVHRKRRQAYPVLLQRMTLANGLRALLADLGIARQAKPVESLATYLASRAAEPPPAAPAAPPAPPAETEDTP